MQMLSTIYRKWREPIPNVEISFNEKKATHVPTFRSQRAQK